MRYASGNLISQLTSIYRHPDGVLPNTLALLYVVTGYGLGLYLLALSGWAFVPGVLLLAHSLVIAAYLMHECTHGSLFRAPKEGERDYHELLAAILSWLTGACYGPVSKIRDKHLRHHFERADIVAVDYRDLLSEKPPLKKTVELGQRLGLPAVELLMHALVMVRPFGEKGTLADRQRVVIVAAVRLAFFVCLGLFAGWQVLAGYGLAYICFLLVMNFMDAFQHQYLMLEGLDQDRSQSPVRNRERFPADYFTKEYENSHTYSNLLSERWPILNLLVLNFPYHNVHHRQPMEPWYRLPALHQETVAQEGHGIKTVPFRRQLRDFIRYRTERVMAPAGDELLETNLGAAGVSFLTPL